jgi:hypothetical protein
VRDNALRLPSTRIREICVIAPKEDLVQALSKELVALQPPLSPTGRAVVFLVRLSMRSPVVGVDVSGNAPQDEEVGQNVDHILLAAWRQEQLGNDPQGAR